MKYYKIIIYLLPVFFSSCLFDGGSKKEIVGSYYLYRWEGGTPFYIDDGWGEPNGGGLLEGTVQEISWNEDYIFAKRKSTFGGDPSGWMIIDVNDNEIIGPFTDEELINKQKELIGSQAVKRYFPEKAWEILK